MVNNALGYNKELSDAIMQGFGIEEIHIEQMKIELNCLTKVVGTNEFQFYFIGTNQSTILVLISSDNAINYKHYNVSCGTNEKLNIRKIVYGPEGDQMLFVWADGKEKSYILIAQVVMEPIWLVFGEWELGLFKDFNIKNDKVVLCGSNGILCYNNASIKEPYGCILHKRMVRDIIIDNVKL